MFILKSISFLLIVCVAKSEIDFQTMCKANYSYMNNTRMDVMKYCNNSLCIEKCCGDGEFFNLRGICTNVTNFFKKFSLKTAKLQLQINYNNISVYSWDGSNIKKSKKNSEDIVLIQNRRVNNCTYEHSPKNKHYILEDGSIRMQDTTGSKSWVILDRLQYCVDYRLFMTKKPVIEFVIRENYVFEADVEEKSLFVTIACLVSSFFLLLVFVVYCLLPKLQNLNGLVLMAYIMCLLITFLMKVVINLKNKTLTNEFCKTAAPMLYFAVLSSFFWLSIMSFDTWWALRGFRKQLNINRRGILVKFMWYSLYAWGCPLLITAVVTTLDNIDLSNLPYVVKPPFDDCFVNESGIFAYYTIPVAVIVCVNVILFIMTVYNIWMIKRAVIIHRDSRVSQQQTNRFGTYIKLSVIMGVSWLLEVIPNVRLSIYILVNTYNLFTGVAIFFLFVFKKRILVMLCKRFNVKNDFAKKSELSQYTRSGTTRTTRVSTVKSQSKDQQLELDILVNCPKKDREESVKDGRFKTIHHEFTK